MVQAGQGHVGEALESAQQPQQASLPRGSGLLSPTLSPAPCPTEPEEEDSEPGLPGSPLSGSPCDSTGEAAGGQSVEGG